MEELVELREQAGASEEDLLLLALFGEDAERLLDAVRDRGERTDAESGGASRPTQAEKIQELIRMVEQSDVGELTLEDGTVRITVRKQDDALVACAWARAGRPGERRCRP